MRYTRCVFRCSNLPFQPSRADHSPQIEQNVANFALPSRKTFAATAVYGCCYKNSSLKCRTAGCEGCSAVAGANFSPLLLCSDAIYTCDNSFPNSRANRDKRCCHSKCRHGLSSATAHTRCIRSCSGVTRVRNKMAPNMGISWKSAAINTIARVHHHSSSIKTTKNTRFSNA